MSILRKEQAFHRAQADADSRRYAGDGMTRRDLAERVVEVLIGIMLIVAIWMWAYSLGVW